MNKRVVNGFLSLFLLFHLGCATIITGSTETIEIKADKAETNVYINNILIGQTKKEESLRAEIPKKGDIQIKLTHLDCKTELYQIEKVFEPTSLLGILFDGGVFSILVVDFLATGAISKASKRNFDFILDCSS